MISPKVTCSKTEHKRYDDLLTTGYGSKMVWSDGKCFNLSKSTLVPVLLDVINVRTAAPNLAKSAQKIWPEPDLAGFAKKGRMPDLLETEPKSSTSPVSRDMHSYERLLQ